MRHINLSKSNESELSEYMIDTALKDGFESIYVHSIDSLFRKAV